MPLEFTLEKVADEPNQLIATWMAPKPPNGVITSYSLTCTLSHNQVLKLELAHSYYSSHILTTLYVWQVNFQMDIQTIVVITDTFMSIEQSEEFCMSNLNWTNFFKML